MTCRYVQMLVDGWTPEPDRPGERSSWSHVEECMSAGNGNPCPDHGAETCPTGWIHYHGTEPTR